MSSFEDRPDGTFQDICHPWMNRMQKFLAKRVTIKDGVIVDKEYLYSYDTLEKFEHRPKIRRKKDLIT